MVNAQFELLEGLVGEPTPEQCFERIAEQARKMGFEYCTHGMRVPVPITRPRTTMHSNYPPAWLKRYHDEGFMEIDPTIAHGMRSSTPVVWDDAFFAGVPHLWQEAQSHGLRYGWAQSRRDSEGTYSMLIVARSDKSLNPDELRALTPRLQWLVGAGHEAMKRSGAAPARDTETVALTNREIDVLRWTAEGKTSAEVADILDISERTVNFHVNTVVAKLGVTNKTSAAVRAAMLGLLW